MSKTKEELIKENERLKEENKKLKATIVSILEEASQVEVIA